MANEFLTRIPTSAGNQKVFTYSCWIKRNKISEWMRLLSIMNGNTDAIIQLTNVDKLRFRDEVTGPDIDYISSRPLRDVGSWMHLLVAIDTTAPQAEHRIRMYINGDSLIEHGLDTESMPGDKNLDLQFNDKLEHRFFARNNNSEYFFGEAFDLFWVDGQALTPDVFGFNKDGDGYVSVGSTQSTDFRPGQWSPKAPRIIKSEINRRGGFGVNGVYLPMNDSSNFGADFHCAPNSIITLKGEDLPQPRNGLPTTSDNYVSQLRSDPYAANLVLAVPGVNTQPTGPELVTNGTFDTNVSGWTVTDTGSIVRQSDGTAKVTRGSAAEVVYQNITTVVGTTYELSVDITDIAGSHGQVYVRSTYNSGSLNTAIGYSFYPGTFKGTFTADTTTTRIILYAHPSGSTSYDNISVKATTIRDYSADIKGSGTNKTITPYADASVSNPHQRNGRNVNGYYGSALTFDGSGDYFSIPHSSDFDFSTGDFTAECWINPTSLPSADKCILEFRGSGGGSDGWVWFINSSNVMQIYDGGTLYTAASGTIIANQLNHIAISRKSGIFTYYLNGVAVGILTTYTTSTNASSTGIRIGIRQDTTNGYFGYIQDLRVYKGVAKYTGGFDVPKPYAPENGNTNYGIETWRQVPDTCKNNFATWNFLSNSSGTLSEGNLSLVGNDASGGGTRTNATIAVSSGKWYFEVLLEQAGAATDVGIAYNDITNNAPGVTNGGSGDYGYLLESANTYNNNSSSSYGSSLTTGDIFMCAFDVDTHKLYFGKNGIWFGSSNPATGSNPAFSITSGYSYRPVARPWANGSANAKIQTNFGQNPAFGGTRIAGTYTDSNGKGLFKYQPPTGFLALCEDNLPAPTVADPGEHFKTVLYTGTGSSRAVTGVGFKPDFVWIKNRDSAYQHQVYDSVRGAGQKLLPSTTNAEVTDTANVSSFDSNGFSFAGGNVGVNQDTKNHVAWCWKAGGAAVSNTDGALTSQVSVNQDAGFSIVTYTTPGTATNFGHGLGKKPAFALFKARNDTGNWAVYHQSLGTNTIRLSTTDAQDTGVDAFNNTAPTDTLMYLGTWAGTNNPNINWVSYLWSEIEGYSKFGSYTGNGSTDGPFVYCGFKPAFVMTKRTDTTGEWWMYDSSRGSTNPNARMVMANNTSVEQEDSASYLVDFLSNGFKIRAGLAALNGNSGSFIFMAFAESPFQTANAK